MLGVYAMPVADFHGRDAELRLLDDLWATPQATLLILYGRRRVGKTRLLTHWISQTGQRALYWVAEPTSPRDQLRAFSQIVFNLANPLHPAPDDFAYATWTQAWQQIAPLTQSARLALFVDEFTYLLEAEPGIAGIIQNVWDHTLKQTNLFLTLSGSHLGMMQRQVLSYQAPLYGRSTAQLGLLPLPFGMTRAFFPQYDADERVAIYAIWGGIPAYWERLDPSASISDNIRRQLLTANNLMQEEPRLLLQDFVTEPNNYVSILRAIAHGAREQKEIAGRTGLPSSHISKYLSTLREASFVERRVPVTATDTSRLGRYYIIDPYLRFYYRFLATRQTQLALGLQDQALAEIRQHLLDFIGTHTWEELCREWLLRASACGNLPFMPDQVGSTWTRQAQVDVVGVNSMEKTLILGECKWSPQQVGRDVLNDLVDKTACVVPVHGHWTVYYLGFARGGWSNEAAAFARALNQTSSTGANWHTAGMRLLDLGQIDTDLTRWAA